MVGCRCLPVRRPDILLVCSGRRCKNKYRQPSLKTRWYTRPSKTTGKRCSKHPTLLPPPPRDPDEKPPALLTPPKPPPGWAWRLCKTDYAELDKEQPDPTAQSELGAEESAAVDKEQPDPIASLKAERDQISRETEDQIFREIKDPNDPGSPWNPAPGWRWEYQPYGKSWFAHRK